MTRKAYDAPLHTGKVQTGAYIKLYRRKSMFSTMFTTLAGLVLLTMHWAGAQPDQNQGKLEDSPDHNANSPPVGHLKPFGAHRPAEGNIDQVSGFPEPTDFYEKYVKPSKPVLFKHAATGIPAFQLWTDSYLGYVGISTSSPDTHAGLYIFLQNIEARNLIF